VKLYAQPKIFLILALAGCASTRAPDIAGSIWSGQEGSRLTAQLQYRGNRLPEGWLYKVPQNDASGSFVYRKRSGTYNYSDRGYFAIDLVWRSESTYVGVLKPGAVFCVVNPEMQGDAADKTITTYRVYDYCAQLHSQ
jgi:hypothetical protein